MTSSASVSPRDSKTGWIHFGVVVGFLLIVSFGWGLAMGQFNWWFRKEPVAWPAGVKVNEKTFQNQSMPERFGPYRMYKEEKYADDMLSTLKIGSTLDDRRYPERKSNWYINRIYEDTREAETSPYRLWHLDVVFYTGGEVTVPHVPDICVQAGGATPTGRKELKVKLPGRKEPWDHPSFTALSYERTYQGHSQELVQYYLFDVNGIPETRRETVRLNLAIPTWRYVFYSKIQFFPLGNVESVKIADEKAGEFLRYALPAVLTQLPSAEDIEALYKQEE
ncbi:MAG: hypothetical protein JXA11_10460 [Phycisphaerae bacterium]|nr:hypothetical protein [Phycisphaerae bacterium]